MAIAPHASETVQSRDAGGPDTRPDRLLARNPHHAPSYVIDLHTHSIHSDGGLTPAELACAASEHGITTLALTDHDTVAGLDPTAANCAKEGIQLTTGVEISVTWRRRTLHIVGLAFDPDAPALTTGLAGLQACREQRAETMAAKLERLGERNVLARAKALAGPGQIGRFHFARALVDSGRCANMQQAFQRFLKPGKPAHVSTEWAALDDAIGWIHAAYGIAILAHPFGYRFSGAWRRRMVAGFAQAGGDGLEVCTGTTNAQQVAVSAADAAAYGLLASVGSDFHSPEQFWLSLGGVRSLPAGLTPVWDDPRFHTLV